MLRRQLAAEDRSVGGQGEGSVAVSSLHQDALVAEGVDGRGSPFAVAVGR